jgi:hypothetical protein
MVAHGADPTKVDEETFTDICIMFSDGIIGNLGLLQLLGNHTAGVFNSLLPKGKQPYKLQDIIPTQYEYLFPPLTEQDKKELANKSLLNFVKSKPKAPKKLFEDKKWHKT